MAISILPTFLCCRPWGATSFRITHRRTSLVRGLPRVASGEVLLALGLTEPGSGSDAANLRLRAEKADNGWVLNGEKASISLAAQADAIVLFARTGRQEERAKGVSAFLSRS